MTDTHTHRLSIYQSADVYYFKCVKLQHLKWPCKVQQLFFALGTFCPTHGSQFHSWQCTVQYSTVQYSTLFSAVSVAINLQSFTFNL